MKSILISFCLPDHVLQSEIEICKNSHTYLNIESMSSTCSLSISSTVPYFTGAVCQQVICTSLTKVYYIELFAAYHVWCYRVEVIAEAPQFNARKTFQNFITVWDIKYSCFPIILSWPSWLNQKHSPFHNC